MVFHLFCNEKGLTEVSFCTRKSAVGALKGREEAEGMHSLAFRLPKPPKTQWSLLRQICVCVCAQSCAALYCTFESSFLLKVKEIVFSVRSVSDYLLPCHRLPSGNGWLQRSLIISNSTELVGLSKGIPTRGLSWGESPLWLRLAGL